MPVHKVCETCGKEFKVPPRRADEVRFCSRDCKTRSGRQVLSCGACGKLFERTNAETRGATSFCSKECSFSARKGRRYNVAERPRYFATCEVCKTEFRITQTRVGTARFCSRVCKAMSPAFAVENSQRQQAEKSWRWKGGIYKNSRGYVRHKRQVLGEQEIAYIHRAVMLEAMAAACPEHPFLVRWEGKLRLRPEIEVHHIDRNRANNELSNLLAITSLAHLQLHSTGRKPQPWECWPPDPVKW